MKHPVKIGAIPPSQASALDELYEAQLLKEV
jgi:hypothetical protein